MSLSLRWPSPGSSTTVSSTTAVTPATRCAASSAAHFSGKLLTVPFNVAIPDFTETAMSALCKLGSHASSVVTARCTFRSFSCVSLSDFFVG